MKWMNLPEQYTKKESRFTILPLSYEKALTYGKGASLGPHEIIKASQHLEYYDEQFDCEAFEEGIHLEEEMKLSELAPKEMVEKVTEKVATTKKQKRNHKKPCIISLGGDHAVTIGICKGFDEISEDYSIIFLDAHSDFRDSWNNSRYNHACTAKRVAEKHDIAILGVRSQDIDEVQEMQQRKDVHILRSYDYTLGKLKEILPKLKEKVYISIDVDCFDPSFIRNTGTPEPGGLTWHQVIEILETIFANKAVIGADIVEFAPVENFRAEAYALARLAYKIMSLEKKYGG